MYKFRIFYKHNDSVGSTRSAFVRLLVNIRSMFAEMSLSRVLHAQQTPLQNYLMSNLFPFKSLIMGTLAQHLNYRMMWFPKKFPQSSQRGFRDVKPYLLFFYTSARRISSAKHLCTHEWQTRREEKCFSMSRWRWARKNKRANNIAVTQYSTWNYSRELWR